MSQERFAGKSSKVKHVGTHGAKMNGKSNVPVIEQGDDLFFYKINRNEPVPPDPCIISAIKHTVAVPPLSKHNIPKDIAPKPPVLKQGRNHSVGANRRDNGIPSYNNFFTMNYGDTDENPERPSDVAGNREIENPQRPSDVHGNREIENPERSLDVHGNRGIENPLIGEQKQLEKVSKVGMSSSVCLGGLQALRDRKYQNSTTDALCKKDRRKFSESDRKGPEVFLSPKNQPLMDVKISSALSAKDFMVLNVDEKKMNEVEKLEQEMYSWCKSDEGQQYLANFCEGSIRKRSYYGLFIPEQNTCVRVQVLYLDNRDDAYVFFIDYGAEQSAPKKRLIPLHPEWKRLEQQSCHAELEGGYADQDLQKFKDKYEFATVCVKPECMFPKEKVSDGISVKVKCWRISIFDEQNAIDSF